MDAYRAIISKRDRREYDTHRPVAEAVLGRILQAGRMAGSSSNSQPCRFIVLLDQTNRDALLLPLGRGTAPIGRAPLVIAVLLQKGARDFDVGRAVQNMMVAAWAEGIISCPVGIQEREGARKALGYPDDFETPICVAFGYPEESHAAPVREPRPRLPLEELVHRERW